ncbi:peroxiredoxin family protein [Pinibacter soli]|uniref:TlpA disulfide reductase family protein n=1 Tax=Pinibacter soli TaxID=3044211 RepID=A0ABT6RHR8_9BACT|nr:TlpA disulfide reductase family protein [Pinibacter soli]MDI3322078.1 TlpA disulfide reductase family protein [Pinibacter soli]
MKQIITFLTVTLFITTVYGQTLKNGVWRGVLQRTDGNEIAFNFDVKQVQGKSVFIIHNAAERLEVKDISFAGDSCFINMPFFESQFRLKVINNGELAGLWIRGSSAKNLVVPFKAVYGKTDRYPITAKASHNISGRWATTFSSADGNEQAIAELVQKGQKVTGTFLTTTGDYRFQEGVVNNDFLQMSGFDGGHAYYFSAKIKDAKHLSDGLFVSGPAYKQSWIAEKNDTATLPQNEAAMYVRSGEDKLNFSFTDLEGVKVSINDERFKNKVVVIQIMGSWCPNCMDETAFLSRFYDKNKNRGIEMVALAYEYSEDYQRSQKSLRKFQERFNVQYPILITGVRANDTLRTQKTLPQLTPIMTFPSTVFVGKDGKVKKIDTGFNGPGTGVHYDEYKKEFNRIIDELLN